MTPQRAEQVCAFMQFIAQILDGGYEVEPACRERAAQLLHESPPATTYTPPVSPFREPVHLSDE